MYLGLPGDWLVVYDEEIKSGTATPYKALGSRIGELERDFGIEELNSSYSTPSILQ